MSTVPTSYNMYIFFDDESATLWETPILRNVSAEADAVTIEQMYDIFRATVVHETRLSDYDKEQIALINTWSIEKVSQALWDVCGLMLNTLAVIPADKEEKITKRGNKLAERFGGDSSTYQACADFAEYLHDHAVKIFKFPECDGNLFYGDME